MTNSDNWTPWMPEGCLTNIPPTNRGVDTQIAALGRAIGKYPDESVIAPSSGITLRQVSDGPTHHRSAANDNYPRLIALTGAAGSGKSTAANYLVEHHGYVRVRFAGPLKDMMRAIGMAESEIEGDEKETEFRYLGGKTPRYAMQTLGTEWGRNCMGEDFWVNLWRERTIGHDRVVVDDCRFPNEAEVIHELGGKIIKITGRGGIAGAHASEAGCGVSDGQVTNDGCIVDLYAAVEQEVRRWSA